MKIIIITWRLIYCKRKRETISLQSVSQTESFLFILLFSLPYGYIGHEGDYKQDRKDRKRIKIRERAVKNNHSRFIAKHIDPSFSVLLLYTKEG